MTDQKLRNHRIQFILWQKFPDADRYWVNRLVTGEEGEQFPDNAKKIYDQISPLLGALKQVDDEGVLRVYLAAREKTLTPAEIQQSQKILSTYLTWAKMAYWTIDEGIALIMGCSPRQISYERILPLVDTDRFAHDYRELFEIAVRAVETGQLLHRNHPSFFLAWAGRMEIGYPPELELEIVSLGTQIDDWKTLFDRVHEAYCAVNTALDHWQKEYTELEALNNNTVAEANHIIAEREGLIDALWEEIFEARNIQLAPLEPEYTSPYLELMQRAIAENEITADSQSKKDVLKSWFLENAPEGARISDKKADMMATLIRLPEAEIGGNKKHRNPSTLPDCTGSDIEE